MTWTTWKTSKLQSKSHFSDEDREMWAKSINAVELALLSCPRLLGSEPIGADVAELDHLRSQLKKDVPLAEYLQRQTVLLAFLRDLKKQGWPLEIPAAEVVLKREASFFLPTTPIKARKGEQLRQDFLQLVREIDPSLEQCLGLGLLSAILFGGLLDSKWWHSWLKQVDSLSFCPGYTWMSLQRKVVNKIGQQVIGEEIEHLHWPVDSVSELLLLKFVRMSVTIRPEEDLTLSKVLVPLLNRLGFSSVKSFEQILPELRCEYALRGCPGALHGNLAGVNTVTSLNKPTWARLLTDQALANSMVSDNVEDPDLDQGWDDFPCLEIIPDADLQKARQEILFQQMMRIFSATKPSSDGEGQVAMNSKDCRRILGSFVENNKACFMTPLRVLADWALHLLTRKQEDGVMLQPASVKRYLQSFGEHFINLVEQESLLECDPDDFLEWYLELIQRHIDNPKSKSEDVYCATVLVRFHVYLVKKFGAPRIPLSELHAEAKGAVNANLLSTSEFEDVLKALEGRGRTTRAQQMAILIAVLGFYCGLRFTEIRSLQLRDIQGWSRPTIEIRSNSIAKKKTVAAHRWLQLFSLMPHYWQRQLVSWRDRRLLEAVDDQQALLFAMQNSPKLMLRRDPCFKAVVSAMRTVSGDPSLCFHHLRHSAANWFFLRLLGVTKEQRNKYRFLNHEIFDDEKCQSLRREYLGSQAEGRNFLYATAIFLGHSSPASTVQSYLHLFDWMTGEFLRQKEQQPQLDYEQAKRLSGLGQARLYQLAIVDKDGDKAWLATDLCAPLRKKHLKSELEPFADIGIARRSVKSYRFPDEDLLDFIPWQMVCLSLQELEKGVKFSVVSRRRHIPQAQLVGWSQSAKYIKQIRTRGQKNQPGRLRHVWSEDQADFPSVPASRIERNLVTLLWEKFHRLDGEEMQVVHDAVETFLHKFSSYRPFVTFDLHRELKAFLKALRLIGLPESLIHIVVLRADNAVEIEEKKQAGLAHRYGLKTHQVQIESRGMGKVEGTLGIKIGMEKAGRFYVSPAFRCFVYCLAIARRSDCHPDSGADREQDSLARLNKDSFITGRLLE